MAGTRGEAGSLGRRRVRPGESRGARRHRPAGRALLPLLRRRRTGRPVAGGGMAVGCVCDASRARSPGCWRSTTACAIGSASCTPPRRAGSSPARSAATSDRWFVTHADPRLVPSPWRSSGRSATSASGAGGGAGRVPGRTPARLRHGRGAARPRRALLVPAARLRHRRRPEVARHGPVTRGQHRTARVAGNKS